jgi:hypothetical protein
MSWQGCGRYIILGTVQILYWSLLLTKYYSGDQMKKNEMGEACGMYGVKERCIQSFGGET